MLDLTNLLFKDLWLVNCSLSRANVKSLTLKSWWKYSCDSSIAYYIFNYYVLAIGSENE